MDYNQGDSRFPDPNLDFTTTSFQYKSYPNLEEKLKMMKITATIMNKYLNSIHMYYK